MSNPEQIPVQRYYDEEFYKLECERLWPRVWQMACRLEEIPEVGCWVEYKILDKSVIVVRTKSGVKAFHNVCRHRGVKLAIGGRGECEAQGFTCPFHGWRWNIDGKNTFVLTPQIFSEESLQAAEIDLKPCRVEFWGGSAFINFDDNASPLLECLGPVAERLSARNLEECKIEWWRSTILPTNWKLAMEAFMEGYHTLRTHPQLMTAFGPEWTRPSGMAGGPKASTPAQEFLERTISYMACLSEGMQGEIHPSEVEVAKTLLDMELPEDQSQWNDAFQTRLKDEIYQRGLAKGVPVRDMKAVDEKYPFSYVEFLFPHFFLLPVYSAFAAYRIRPLGPESCRFELVSFTLRAPDEEYVPVTGPTFLAYDSKEYPQVPMQDYYNLPLQQEGLHSGGFEYMRLSRDEEGRISNYQRLIDGFLGGVDQEKLTKGYQIASGAFNTPIVDIGF